MNESLENKAIEYNNEDVWVVAILEKELEISQTLIRLSTEMLIKFFSRITTKPFMLFV
jgi:hypothetical protein